MLGSIGTIGCFSFDYYKTIVSREGGFLTTDDRRLFTRAQNWHDCAACWRPDRFGPEAEGEELFCGENYRMSELQGAVALAQIRRAHSMIAGYKDAKKRIKDEIGKYRGLSFRRIVDESGDSGICLVLYMPDPETTRTVNAALQSEGVPSGGVYDTKVRDWHTYNYWEHILERKSVAADGLPWSAVPEHELPQYSKEMCPRSLYLLSRAILIDINYNYSNEACRQIS